MNPLLDSPHMLRAHSLSGRTNRYRKGVHTVFPSLNLNQADFFGMTTEEIRIPVKLFVSKFPTSLTEDQLREVCVPSRLFHYIC